MKAETKKHLDKIIRGLKKIDDVIAIYLFGSHAKGTQTIKSDIDICVITEQDIPIDVEAEIGSTYSDEIDLVIFKNLPLPIKFRVFHEGKELFVRHERKLARIKFATIKEYLDYEPVLRKLTNAILAAR